MTPNIEMLEEEIDSSRFREMTTTINMPENEQNSETETEEDIQEKQENEDQEVVEVVEMEDLWLKL